MIVRKLTLFTCGFLVACVQPSTTTGPRALFSLDIGETIRKAVVNGQGQIAIATETRVLGIRDGAAAWSEPVKLTPWLVPLSDGTVVLRRDDSRIEARDMGTGKVAWIVGSRIDVGEPIGTDEMDALGRFAWAAPQGMTRTSSKGQDILLSVLEDGRILTIRPDACKAKDARKCSVIRGRIDGHSFAGAVGLEALPGGMLIEEGDRALAVRYDGTLDFALEAMELMGGTKVSGDLVLVTMDDHVATLRPAQCSTQLPDIPGRELLPNLDAPVIRLGTTASVAVATVEVPEGCIAEQHPRKSLSMFAPERLEAQLVANASDGTVFLSERGKEMADLDAVGPLARALGGVVTLSVPVTEGRLSVVRIRSSKVHERVKLPIEVPGAAMSPTGLLLSADGKFVLAGYGTKVALVELTP